MRSENEKYDRKKMMIVIICFTLWLMCLLFDDVRRTLCTFDCKGSSWSARDESLTSLRMRNDVKDIMSSSVVVPTAVQAWLSTVNKFVDCRSVCSMSQSLVETFTCAGCEHHRRSPAAATSASPSTPGRQDDSSWTERRGVSCSQRLRLKTI